MAISRPSSRNFFGSVLVSRNSAILCRTSGCVLTWSRAMLRSPWVGLTGIVTSRGRLVKAMVGIPVAIRPRGLREPQRCCNRPASLRPDAVCYHVQGWPRCCLWRCIGYNRTAMIDRSISPHQREEEAALDGALRPTRLAAFPGQERLKENLSILIEAAKARGEALDHVLFYGPPGLGKTTLSHIIANEMGVHVRITAGPAIERAGDLVAVLTNLKTGDVLFIDEIHRLGRAIEEVLYPAMEDFAVDIILGKGPSARNIRLKLPHFTVVGATTRLALMPAPRRPRFGAV